jgi:hypothetical protein
MIAITLMQNIRQATVSARKRTGNQGISGRVKNGKLQIVQTDNSKRDYAVKPLSDWLTASAAIDYLNAMK